MKRALILFLISAGAFAAFATSVPTAVVTLDNGSPTAFGPDWNWTYTITVSNGDLDDVQSFEIYNVAGVLGAFTPYRSGWDASVTSLGGGLSDVTFTNETDPCFQCSLDGFVIESTLSSKGMANYDVTYSDWRHTDPTVGAPMSATPEPASVGLFGGMAFLAFAGLKARGPWKRASK